MSLLRRLGRFFAAGLLLLPVCLAPLPLRAAGPIEAREVAAVPEGLYLSVRATLGAMQAGASPVLSAAPELHSDAARLLSAQLHSASITQAQFDALAQPQKEQLIAKAAAELSSQSEGSIAGSGALASEAVTSDVAAAAKAWGTSVSDTGVTSRSLASRLWQGISDIRAPRVGADYAGVDDVMAAKSQPDTAGRQRRPNWCWAACAQMLLNYNDIPATQEDVVRYYNARNSHADAFEGVADAALPDLLANSIWGIASILNGWKWLGGAFETRFEVVDREWGALLAQLEAKQPVMALINTGINWHAVVVTGATYDVDAKTGEKSPRTVTFRNPAPGHASRMTFTWNKFRSRALHTMVAINKVPFAPATSRAVLFHPYNRSYKEVRFIATNEDGSETYLGLPDPQYGETKWCDKLTVVHRTIAGQPQEFVTSRESIACPG